MVSSLFVKSHIIEIGGSNDVKLAAGIDKTLMLMSVERLLIGLNARHQLACELHVCVEIFVLALALAETHKLNIGHELFHEVVAHAGSITQELFSPSIVHLCQAHKGEIVVAFCHACIVALAQLQGLKSVSSCLSQTSIMSVI